MAAVRLKMLVGSLLSRAPQEWNLRHHCTVHAVRGIVSGGEVNILIKCVIYTPMTLLVTGLVHLKCPYSDSYHAGLNHLSPFFKISKTKLTSKRPVCQKMKLCTLGPLPIKNKKTSS